MSQTSTRQIPNHKTMWQFPWEYRESFCVAVGILIIGYAIQLVTGLAVSELHYPVNLGVFIVFVLFILSLHGFAHEHNFTRWLRSLPVTISALSMLFIQAMFLGTFPQNNEHANSDLLGLQNVTHSWAFILTLVYFLLNLGLITVNRAIPFQRKNIGFLLNHFGLWLTLTAGMLGAGDLQRYTMDLYVGKPEWRAVSLVSNKPNIIEMPFAFTLQSFNMDVFPPKLVLANLHSGNVMVDNKNYLRQVAKGDQYSLAGWDIAVLDYLPEAKDFNGQYFTMQGEAGAAPAALIRATNQDTHEEKTSWVSCGSFAVNPSLLPLTTEIGIGMLSPEPKRFSSTVIIYTKNGETKPANIEVNKPIKVMGWKVYQLSYDSKLGRWSPLSVIELVRDPWLPVVYSGIALMLAGAVYIIYKSRRLDA
jgi:hypothetical protein